MEKKFWHERDPVFPWDTSKFDGTKETKGHIYFQLAKMRVFPSGEAGRRPDGRITKAVEILLQEVLRRRWILALSPSPQFLQAVAIYLPASFALTTLDYAYRTSSEEAAQMLLAPSPKDDWQDDPAGESAHHLKTAGLLVWSGANEQISRQRAGSLVSDLLGRRATANLPTVFTAAYRLGPGGLKTQTVQAVFDQIELSLGTTVSELVKEKCVVRDFQFSGPEPDVKSFKL